MAYPPSCHLATRAIVMVFSLVVTLFLALCAGLPYFEGNWSGTSAFFYTKAKGSSERLSRPPDELMSASFAFVVTGAVLAFVSLLLSILLLVTQACWVRGESCMVASEGGMAMALLVLCVCAFVSCLVALGTMSGRVGYDKNVAEGGDVGAGFILLVIASALALVNLVLVSTGSVFGVTYCAGPQEKMQGNDKHEESPHEPVHDDHHTDGHSEL